MSMQMSPAAAMGLDDHIYQRLLRERIIFLGSEVARRERQRDLRPDAAARAPRTRRSDIYLYINSPGRLGRRRHGDLRHDAVHPQRRRHRRHGPGRLDGPVPALRRRQGQALRPAARADHDAPALRRHRRHGLATSRSRPSSRCTSRSRCCRADRRSTPARPSSRSRPTPTATAGSPPSRPRTYGFIDHVVTQRARRSPTARHRTSDGAEPTTTCRATADPT